MGGRRDACDPEIRLGRSGGAGVTLLSRIEYSATRHSESSEESTHAAGCFATLNMTDSVEIPVSPYAPSVLHSLHGWSCGDAAIHGSTSQRAVWSWAFKHRSYTYRNAGVPPAYHKLHGKEGTLGGRRDACDPEIRLGRSGGAGVTLLSRIESSATRHSESSEESTHAAGCFATLNMTDSGAIRI